VSQFLSRIDTSRLVGSGDGKKTLAKKKKGAQAQPAVSIVPPIAPQPISQSTEGRAVRGIKF
jgi:hypothetical protein